MDKIEFTDFKNCRLSTAEILEHIKTFNEESKADFTKYIYSLLFHTNIVIDDKNDLEKVVSSWFSYRQGNFVMIDKF
jgi:catechol-2,3-dioxygenase